MKNRYDSLLRKHNKEILDLVAYNPFFFTITAKEIKNLYKAGDRILEIGTGEGDSALPVLKETKAKIDLLDVSKEMIAIAKKKFASYKDQTKFICEDAYDYLAKSKPYNIIFSGWTLHNFKKSDKKKLLKAIYKNIAPGGTFILMDKVYPMKGGRNLFDQQNKRYTKYLFPELAAAIIKHEHEDFSDNYRMDEAYMIDLLKQVGFSSVSIIERLERDLVIIAKKA